MTKMLESIVNLSDYPNENGWLSDPISCLLFRELGLNDIEINSNVKTITELNKEIPVKYDWHQTAKSLIKNVVYAIPGFESDFLQLLNSEGIAKAASLALLEKRIIDAACLVRWSGFLTFKDIGSKAINEIADYLFRHFHDNAIAQFHLGVWQFLRQKDI